MCTLIKSDGNDWWKGTLVYGQVLLQEIMSASTENILVLILRAVHSWYYHSRDTSSVPLCLHNMIHQCQKHFNIKIISSVTCMLKINLFLPSSYDLLQLCYWKTVFTRGWTKILPFLINVTHNTLHIHFKSLNQVKYAFFSFSTL